ncbi:DUF317 domain-containing protein [Streptomyces sp. R41]|uniref:DUF317 domain-containing protein n=1 Tax=Streptomyces sp. R41 TaxID=3238632 RepID=A0AB39RTQ3_9ACTN
MHSDTHRWLLWGGQDGYSSRWYASFTSRTPIQLIEATTARLADPAPVLRYAPEVPSRNRGAARITPVTPPVPTPLDVRRAAAARARTTIPRAVVRASDGDDGWPRRSPSGPHLPASMTDVPHKGKPRDR